MCPINKPQILSHQKFTPTTAAMASTSINLTNTFIGLAKLQKTSLSGTHFPRLWRNITFRHRSFATTSTVTFSRAKQSSRSFTVSATTTPTQQQGDYDVLTKIPPDDRIPATIITGFLGSGKVIISPYI